MGLFLAYRFDDKRDTTAPVGSIPVPSISNLLDTDIHRVSIFFAFWVTWSFLHATKCRTFSGQMGFYPIEFAHLEKDR